MISYNERNKLEKKKKKKKLLYWIYSSTCYSHVCNQLCLLDRILTHRDSKERSFIMTTKTMNRTKLKKTRTAVLDLQFNMLQQ